MEATKASTMPETCIIPSCAGKLIDYYGKGTSLRCLKCPRTYHKDDKGRWEMRDPLS